MTVEADIYSALRGLVADRAYPDFAPEGAAAPYITYQQVGGEAFQFLERALLSKKHGRFQVAVWATTRAEAAAIGLQIEAAILLATSFQAYAIGAQTADHDEATRLRGNRQDFGIWSER